MADLTLDDVLAESPHAVEAWEAAEIRRLAMAALDDLRAIREQLAEEVRPRVLDARARLATIIARTERALVEGPPEIAVCGRCGKVETPVDPFPWDGLDVCFDCLTDEEKTAPPPHDDALEGD